MWDSLDLRLELFCLSAPGSTKCQVLFPVFIIIIKNLMYLKGQEMQKETKRDSPSLIHSLMLTIAGAEARSQEPGINLGPFYGCQGPKCWSHPLLPPRVHISRKLGQKRSRA